MKYPKDLKIGQVYQVWIYGETPLSAGHYVIATYSGILQEETLTQKEVHGFSLKGKGTLLCKKEDLEKRVKENEV